MKSTLAKERIGDAAVSGRTGKTWSEWFLILDRAGAEAMEHKATVALLTKHGLDGWWAQMVTVGYEQERGKRQKHEKPEGFQVSGSKTVTVSVASLYRAWTDANARKRWLANPSFSVSKATRNKSLRIKWNQGTSRVDVNFYAKGTGKSQVTVQHGRLPNASAAERMKVYWREYLGRLKALLEDKASS